MHCSYMCGQCVVKEVLSQCQFSTQGIVVQKADTGNTIYQASVFQMLHIVAYWINHYSVEKCWQNKPHYPLDSDLSGG